MTEVIVHSTGPPGGPTREQRGGKDHVGDVTLDEIRQLPVVGETIEGTYPIPTLDEAFDLSARIFKWWSQEARR